MILHCTFGIVSFSEKAMHEMKQIRRDSMKPMLGNLAKLAKDVPPNAPLLFGSEEDINKEITKIMAINLAMAKSMRGKFSKNLKTPPPYCSRYGRRGQRGEKPRGRPNRRPSRKQKYNGNN